VDTLSYKTKYASSKNLERKWWVVDAENQTVGRMASRLATILQGKHKPAYSPNLDCGDYVIVINADKVVFTGKKQTQKKYISHTGYPGGQRERTPKQLMATKPEFIVENAIKHMLPRTRMGRAMYGKLHVYAGNEHPHAGQQPEVLNL
jgi:large subunit ribosomal protein L13